MKKFVFAMLTLIICISMLSSCSNGLPGNNHSPSTNDTSDTSADIPNPGNKVGFKMLRYNWDGHGIAQKEIKTCDLGYAIIDSLSKLEKTGDVIPKFPTIR